MVELQIRRRAAFNAPTGIALPYRGFHVLGNFPRVAAGVTP
jgi:hypothetical protein